MIMSRRDCHESPGALGGVSAANFPSSPRRAARPGHYPGVGAARRLLLGASHAAGPSLDPGVGATCELLTVGPRRSSSTLAAEEDDAFVFVFVFAFVFAADFPFLPISIVFVTLMRSD